MSAAPATVAVDPSAVTAPARFRALDVFRGATVCVMIVVNTLGPGPDPFPWLVHARWFGFTLADLVFPSFLFAVGNALSFTLARPVADRVFLARTARRTALIFLIGVLMFWYPFVHRSADGALVGSALADVRIMGVLQRIALCFAAAALAARFLPERALLPLCAALLLGYWFTLWAFGEPGAQLTPLGAAPARLDRAVLGLRHMYRRGHGYDPEGLLSTMPAVVNVLAGHLAGRWLARRPDKRRAVVRLAAAGVGLVVLGEAWSLLLPLSKRLWTSSFTVLTIGLDLLLLAAAIAYVDVFRRRAGVRFLEVFGRNPLAVYLFSELFLQTLSVFSIGGRTPYEVVGWTVFQAVAPGPVGSLACGVAYMLVCWLFGAGLARRSISLRL